MTIEKLLTVMETVRRHGDKETVAWLESGLTDYLTGGKDRLTLDNSLGLQSPGRGYPTPRTAWAKSKRDEALKAAYRLLDGTPTKRCDDLARHIRDFSARMWPNWRKSADPPAGCSELRRNLFIAAKTGEPLPDNWRVLWGIIKGY